MTTTAHPGLIESRPVVGAIRWDAWHGDHGSPGNAVQQALSPAKWHCRLPFFAKVTGTNSVTIDGTAQSVMDQEIAYAKLAGLDYWAFVTYADDDPMSIGLKRYLSSRQRGDIKFCLLTECSRWHEPKFVDRLVGLLSEPGYQEVAGGRPLIYLGFIDETKLPGGVAGLRRAVDSLRARVVAAGRKNPYLVIMDFVPADGQKWVEALGADALSSYATQGGGHGSYADLTGHAEEFWERCRATGKLVVPIVMAGWDRRPRVEFPMFWEPNQKPGVGIEKFYETPSPEQLAGHLDRTLQWSKTHAAPAVIIYAWNENDEGGWIVPTLSEGDARLRAIRGVIHGR